MGVEMSGVNLPGHRQMGEFIARCFLAVWRKGEVWAVGSRLLLNVILQRQLWKAESSA